MVATTNAPVLWYFADPMCSWCWGFSTVITQIKSEYSDQVKIALNLGGLRPGTTEPLSGKMRAEILHHWQDVNRVTGQRFKFEGAMPGGFIYDTEPASRAVLVFGRLNPKDTLAYFTAIQTAFYAEGQDVTQTDILVDLANQFVVEENEFISLFQSDKLKEDTRTHFTRTRQAGVTGFPTVMWQDGDRTEVLCTGYRSYPLLFEQIKERVGIKM